MTSDTPAWLNQVPVISSPELDAIDEDLKAGFITEEESKPLILAASLRATGESLAKAAAKE